MRVFVALFFVFGIACSHAWNAMGHKLVAQIAYDNLTPAAKTMCDKYTRAYNTKASRVNFVSAASWMDSIRKKDVHWFDSLHYIDKPFTQDDSPLPAIQTPNALWGIKQALIVLSSDKASLADKGLSLRILTHLIGDIHQPLHTITQVSKRHPQGDLGGNLFPLAKNPIGDNLHKYWDNGGGILIGSSKEFQIQNKARQLQTRWSCSTTNKEKKPKQWINASHQLALNEVYGVAVNKTPGKNYQLKAQNITQKQILLAGCRLSSILNEIAQKQSNGSTNY